VRIEESAPGNPPRYYNSIYVIDGRGQIVAATDKIHLVPFGEYVPFETILNSFGIGNVVQMPGGFTAGTRREILNLPSGLSLYPLICYEIIFPEEMEGIGGADAILNLTNDAWFGITPGPYQHFQQARVRAVEAGLPLIRDANNGISAVVNPYGEIVAGLELDKKGYIDSTLDTVRPPQFYGYSKETYFWLIETLLFVIAAFSRIGFVFRQN
jgi:apolipoprotein N-acyltransferase